MKSATFFQKAMFLILPLCVALLSLIAFQGVQAGQDKPAGETGITAAPRDKPEVKMAPEFDQGDHHKALENDVTVVTRDGMHHKFSIELAVKGDEQEKGLMFRESMPEDHGMLFVFRVIKEHAFWMKNTLIPLDMLFIEQDGRIQHIHHNARPQDLSMITSSRPSKAVLEINGGMADRLGIKEGDYVHHSAFRNLNRLGH